MGNFFIKLFVKDYRNTSDPKVRERYGKFAGVVGIVSNLLLCMIKILAGVFSASIAIIADGINNLADTSSSVMTLVGFRLASIPEDKDHPYGHARIEYLTGLFVSVLIIVLGLHLLKTSVDKIIHPDPVEFSAVLASVLIGKFTGLQTDGWMGCLVALFIVWSGIQLVKETSSPLLGEAPDESLVRAITETVKREPGVLGMHDLMVHNYGPGKIFASIHIEVDADGDLMKSHDMIDNIERLVKESLHIEFVVHMDPVKVNDPLINKMRSIIEDAFSPLEGVESIHDFRIVPGPTHTNIIFDVVLAPDCRYPEAQLRRIASQAVRAVDEKYYVVITFDKAYTELS